MCTFLSTLPRKSKTAGTITKRNLQLFMRPTTEREKETNETLWYRFRLLNFASKSSDRDHPFIQRYLHRKWKNNEEGRPEVEAEVVCPVTKWMSWEGDRYNCPICRFANQQWNTLKETNWKDADARKKNKEFSRKYQAIIPVYVVSDPNYDGNNGKYRVLIFDDKKFYDELLKKIEKQLLKGNCFNGVNAADICMHMAIQDEVINEGQPNEWVWHKKVIDKICFSKPYDLPAITKESVDAFPFDDTYYVGSTKDEIQEFYNKYIKVSNDDLVMDDDDDGTINVFESPKETPVSKTNAVKQNKLFDAVQNEAQAVSGDASNVEDDDLDALVADIPEASASAEPIKTVETKSNSLDSDESLDDLLAGLPD